MAYIINGNYYELKPTNEDLEKLFIQLHESYLGNKAFDWNNFKLKSFDFFDSLINKDKKTKIDFQKNYLNNFNIIWKPYFFHGDYSRVQDIFTRILDLVTEWEKKYSNELIHKGGLFYFWGMNSIKMGDLEMGYSLMHKALEEDKRTMEIQNPQTPALFFATADYAKTNQAFIEWPSRQASFLHEFIENYNKEYSKQLTLDYFREHFLTTASINDVIYLFTFNLSKLYQIDSSLKLSISSKTIFESDFAGQILIEILFNISLVIDVAIRAKNPTETNLIDQITYLSQKGNLGIQKDDWGELNKSFQGNFDSTIISLLKHSYQVNNKGTLGDISHNNIPYDIGLVYGIRNYAAHNIKPAKSIWENFIEIQQKVFNVIFYTCEILYE
jgi:hypothetical protein